MSSPATRRQFHVGPWQNRNRFKAPSHPIQHHFHTGRRPYPVERTLLVSGVLDASTHPRAAAGEVLNTPHLEFGTAFVASAAAQVPDRRSARASTRGPAGAER
jgi:hypothetical protein